MRNPKIAMVRYLQPKGWLTVLQVSLNYITERQEISGQYSDNKNVSGDAIL